MELGATICVSQKPRCAECPVALGCAARSGHPPLTRPHAPRKPISKNVNWPLAIVRSRGRILLRRRPTHGMLAGLWELPGGEKAPSETLRAFLARHLRELHGAVTREARIGEIRHSITTRNIRAPIFLFQVNARARVRLSESQWRWLSPSALRRYPISSMTLKAAKIFSSYAKNSL
jgi:A/G-specific adenine glycosylase